MKTNVKEMSKQELESMGFHCYQRIRAAKEIISESESNLNKILAELTTRAQADAESNVKESLKKEKADESNNTKTD